MLAIDTPPGLILRRSIPLVQETLQSMPKTALPVKAIEDRLEVALKALKAD
ncbi:hypothetical protein [Mesorhizobium sp.]|uniref:hypothetical protein n=1 Tax=Mesorhizobium sp. TaxID=1871066 RepID=UPI0025E295F8|nr:hypothetical protein [Mesorhizobium sp.]